MGGANSSRFLNATMTQSGALPSEIPHESEMQTTDAGGDVPTEGQEGMEDETNMTEGGQENTVTEAASVEIPQMPKYDKNAMEDLAPAERLKINQAIANAEQEAR